jgi:hypothetical protein
MKIRSSYLLSIDIHSVIFNTKVSVLAFKNDNVLSIIFHHVSVSWRRMAF